MKRILLMATTMLFAVLVVGGVAYALSVQCGGEGDQNPNPFGCAGTPQDDTIIGTEGAETIDARGGDDRVEARGGEDGIFGRSGVDTLLGEAGDDVMSGHGRGDTLVGGGGLNQYFGASGPDTIEANQSGPGESEAVSAGPGNDIIETADNVQDNINCGSGQDRAFADPGDQINGIPASQVNDDLDPGANNTSCELVGVFD
jgi:hypothetical protein